MSRNHINVLSADVLIALPGGEGTASELALARRYGRPAIAFVRSRDDIPEIPDGTPVTSEWDQVRDFVRRNLKR
jgi:predicted Rossmann-fold nucleotide-binding protein